MQNDIFKAISDGAPGVCLMVNAADLKEAVSMLYERAEHAAAAKVEASKERATITRAEAQRIMGVSSATLWRWSKSGFLKPAKAGAKVLYRRSDIDRVLKPGGAHNAATEKGGEK